MNKFENEQIKHQIYLEQYKSGQADKIIALIDQSDKKIAELLKKTKGIYTKNRYKEIAKKIKQISKSLRNAVKNGTDIDGIIEYELKKQKKLLSAIKDDVIRFNGGKVDFIFPSLEQIRTSALFAPVTDGMTYQSYLDGIEYGLFNAWDSAVRTGYLTGQTTDDIVRGVLGGVSGNGKLADSGSIRSFRNSVYRSARTVLQSFANETRSKVFEANEEYFGDGGNKYEYLATLDARTCLVCGESDGKLFKSLKDAPKIPRHFCCRCLIIPYFDIDGQTRSSADGYVSAKISYSDWLKEQPETVQREVLGKTRFDLYMKGEPMTSFVENGNTLTLAQLNERGVLEVSGGILDKSPAKQEIFANDYYREIANRKSKSDIAKIAKNTGFAEEKIEAVRKHIFEDNEHLLSDGSKVKFSSDARIALAWQRLEQNQAKENDIVLLNHEYVELSFMNKKGYNYEKAHALANMRYPWSLKEEHNDWNVDKIREKTREALSLYL